MKEFNVMDDLETYKKLLDLFPKGKYMPRNQFQRMFFHFPREQFCAVEVLCHLEANGKSLSFVPSFLINIKFKDADFRSLIVASL